MTFTVFDTQRCFRALLAAMAEPGTVQQLRGGLPLVLATLVDHEVALAEAGDRHWSEADFVVVRGGTSAGGLARVRQGTLYDPAAGATAIYELDAVGMGPLTLRLTGPGVGPEPRLLRLTGLAAEEVGLFQSTRADYPCGVDIILVGLDGRCAALPRSTALELVPEPEPVPEPVPATEREEVA
jgi:alpha-D-ribose 1-methylphosphonate 5-triphosphate synthase subunit PhnH